MKKNNSVYNDARITKTDERELNEYVYHVLLNTFRDFSQTVRNELNDMMYFVAKIAVQSGMESIYTLKRYFEDNQIEGIPSSYNRFVNSAVNDDEKELARTLEFYIEKYIDSMRVGKHSFPMNKYQSSIQITNNDFYEIMYRMKIANDKIHEEAKIGLRNLENSNMIMFEPMALLMSDCLEPIDLYLQNVLHLSRNAFNKYIDGVSFCLNAAREQSEDDTWEFRNYRIKWTIRGD